MIKTNIKMRVTPKQSRRVQEICFENGIEWLISNKNIVHLDEPYLVIFENSITYREENRKNDVLNIILEIDADLFIKTNGTCEEDYFNNLYQKVSERVNNHQLQEETYKPYQCRCVTTPIIDKETYLAKYTSKPKDLESALKKIENLHTALNKKVEKNKNQALEITKLLEQKKDLQDKLNQANRVVKIGIDNASELVNFLDKKDDIIKEKDTIISYLESKLK